MNLLAWVLQCACAIAFLVSGSAKSLMSKQRMLATGQTGVAPFPTPIIRIVALSELVGVAGLLLPQATGIAPVLTPIAAGCLAVFMIGAAISHATLGEFKQAAFVNTPLFLALVAIVVIRATQP